MIHAIQRVLRRAIVFGFNCAAKVLRQKPHLRGKEHLVKPPSPLIFTLTHDSYFEIPSLAKVYYSLKPKLDLLIMGKSDFLSGHYLATNYGKNNALLRFVLNLLDKTRLPRAIFRIMNVTTIHRPFVEHYQKRKDEIKLEISQQMKDIKEKISSGISTVVFPEGTTWGFGGLKRIRSGVYQLVDNTLRTAHRKVYLLPINVKVDGLVKGTKDVFINIGKPVFLKGARESFNRRLATLLTRLHTITFSQVAAYYVHYRAEVEKQASSFIEISRDTMKGNIAAVVRALESKTKKGALPPIDPKLPDQKYLEKKINGFIKYCRKKGYLVGDGAGRDDSYCFDIGKIIASYPEKTYRKLNPLGFYANELASLGSDKILDLYNKALNGRKSTHAPG